MLRIPEAIPAGFGPLRRRRPSPGLLRRCAASARLAGPRADAGVFSRTLGLVLLALPLLLAACGEEELLAHTDWLASSSWDDGRAVVCVYRGRVQRYGHWRDAEARDYLVREFHDPVELTKRDEEAPGLLRVLKVNRHLAFSTGTYDYRLMRSLFFDRATGALVKAVGSSQEGCGLVFQRWNARERRLHYSSYWEGEGAGARALPKEGRTFFFDELSVLAPFLPDGAQVAVHPTLLRNRLGAGETRTGTIERQGPVTRLRDGDGALIAEWAHDRDGFLERWRIAAGVFPQEFERVSKRRLYYWRHTDPGDERELEGS